jgi:capsular polysaccharide export protein
MSTRRFGVLSRGIRRIPGIEMLAGAQLVACHRLSDSRGLDAIAGWGRRPSTVRARAYAQRHGLPFVALEDGFLRSTGLGSEDPPLSIVRDDLGIYYDAGTPSRLESLVARPLDTAQRARTRELVRLWRSNRVSKYNGLREHEFRLPGRFVLVVDQTRGDASISYGLAGPGSFAQMLDAALDENPDCTVLVKTHPDVFAGKARGLVGPVAGKDRQRVLVLGDNVHPVGLVEKAEAVYVVTSQIGFEALLWGKPVHTFGMPFYAGWGLTRDRLTAPPRRVSVSLEQLVHAALIDYPRYIDPCSGQPCEVEALVEHLGLQRRMRERFPKTVHALGFSLWKKPIVRDFFRGSEVRFTALGSPLPPGATAVVWGATDPGVAAELPVIRLEDGFLRSVGLGADLVHPLSWVMDSTGIYYDARKSSDLERLLQSAEIDHALCRRAARLRQAIIQAGLSKYNLGDEDWRRPDDVRQVILVPGQVESDAAIRLGTPGICTNLELLRTVRRENPDAYVVYKPHPDVVAGLRRKGVTEDEAVHWCDELLGDCRMGQLLDSVDEVQVMTSLAGFEGLLRGKRVVCHGQPFYAGWGLTEDRAPVSRRTRRLSVDMLVAAVLILYPAYIGRRSNCFISPEQALQELLEWRGNEPLMPVWRRLLRLVLVLRTRLIG